MPGHFRTDIFEIFEFKGSLLFIYQLSPGQFRFPLDLKTIMVPYQIRIYNYKLIEK